MKKPYTNPRPGKDEHYAELSHGSQEHHLVMVPYSELCEI